MIPLFTNTYQARGRVSRAPTEAIFKVRVNDSVTRLKALWQSNNHRVLSDHPLVQALKHSGLYTYQPVELYNAAVSRYPYLSRNLKFTTDFNKGSFDHLRVYPTKDSMIYSTDDYVRVYQAIDDWRNLQPLKCLWLDTHLVDMSIPSDRPVSPGYSAVSVDIPLMTLMYKGFKQSLASIDDSSVLGEEDFVGTYVLPSIIESQVDTTCTSALMSVFYGTYQSHQRVAVNYAIPAYGAEYEKIAKHVLSGITDTRMSYVQILQSIPAVYKASGLEAMQLPDFPSTAQVDWAMFSARIPVIDFLLDVGGKVGRNANQGFINQLKTYTRKVNSSTIPYSSMSDSLALKIENAVKRYQKL